MLIAAIALISGLAGVVISIYCQRVEAKAIDNHSIDDWSKFVKAMGGKRR